MGQLAKYEPRRQDAELIKEGAKAFLPRLKLCCGMSPPVKARPPKAVVGDWFLGKETNLGQEAEFVIIEGLPHALQMDDSGKKVIAESFDPKDPVFQAIKAGRAQYTKGYGWGFDYLLWSPKAGVFCVYFAQKSAKVAAPEFERRLGEHVSFTSREQVFQNGNSAMIPVLATLKEEPAKMFTDADLDAALTIFRNSAPRQKGEETDGEGDPTAPAAKAGGRKAKAA